MREDGCYFVLKTIVIVNSIATKQSVDFVNMNVRLCVRKSTCDYLYYSRILTADTKAMRQLSLH